MNENINLVEILKGCPKGMKLYSPILGDCTLDGIDHDNEYPINVWATNILHGFTKDGKLYNDHAECTLFPSKEQRDWSKFKNPYNSFNPESLKPFDKVLVRNSSFNNWVIDFFQNLNTDNTAACLTNVWKQCIPYNDETKILFRTKDKTPDFYRWWI